MGRGDLDVLLLTYTVRFVIQYLFVPVHVLSVVLH